MELSSAISAERDAHAGIGNTSHDRIRLTATVCWKLFERCTKTSPAHLSRDYGRFRVWCGNLGVRQGGHGSLDWTLKDDEVTEKEVFSMLKDLADDLLQTFDLLTGARLPYEQEELESETLSLSASEAPGELELRLDAIKATISALYQMSLLVLGQGAKRLAIVKAQEYVPCDFGEAELLGSLVFLDRKNIEDFFRDLRRQPWRAGKSLGARIDQRPDGELQDRVLKARCVTASTARRRQLAYWKLHSPSSTSGSPKTAMHGTYQNATIISDIETLGMFRERDTTFDPDEAPFQTYGEGMVVPIEGHEMKLPGPPVRSSDKDAFECPYCFALCHAVEAERSHWEKHILEDLRPYMCTYADCQDSLQLYDNRGEWIAHEETSHRRVWTCKNHPQTNFTAHLDFEAHLRVMDPDLASSDLASYDQHATTIVDDGRDQCPFCLITVSNLPQEQQNFQLHLATHLESWSLSCLSADPEADESYTEEHGAVQPTADLTRKRKKSPAPSSQSKKTIPRSARKQEQGPTQSQSITGLVRKSSESPIPSIETPTSFRCILAQYGCTAAFNAKNEWKRHITTQHLAVGFWRCDQCTYPPSRPNDFNRKDLFVQHVRRMHPPTQPETGSSNNSRGEKKARTRSEVETTEASLHRAAQRCYLQMRSPPDICSCIFCTESFHGANGLESCLEHIGKHMDKQRREDLEAIPVPDWRVDRDLESWLLQHGIIIKRRGVLKVPS